MLGGDLLLNRDSFIPLYFQLKKNIKDDIISGKYKPGNSIPTEKQFMEKHDLSRSTVRQAILELVNEGYLKRLKGKGTFVKENPLPFENKFLGNIKCFSAEMNKKDVSHSTKVLKKDIVNPSSEISKKLSISENGKAFYLKRIRYCNQKPLLIVESYIPLYLCEGIESIDFEGNSLYKILEAEYNIVVHHGKREIQPINSVSDETIRLLKINQDTCLLFMESVVYTQKDVAIEYLQAELLGTFVINVGD